MSEGFESRMSDFTKDFAVEGTRRELDTGALVGARMDFRGTIVRLNADFVVSICSTGKPFHSCN